MPVLFASLLFAAAMQAVPPVPALTPAEQVRFEAASKSFTAGQFAAALPVFKALLTAHPDNMLVANYASEASIDTGDMAFASATLKPLEAAHPNDWLVTELLVRLYAETGDKANRDKEMEKMADLQKRRLTPPNLTQYLVQKDHLPDGRLMILWNSLVPWGNYKVCNYARVFDADGKLLFRITLETSDFDQPLFARDHPQEAAFGDRRYSIDTYSTGPVQANGGHTETHGTVGFLDKKPTYDEVRERFLAIAQGKAMPMSTTVRPVKQ